MTATGELIWRQGVRDFRQGNCCQPDNPEYMRGWSWAWGFADGRDGAALFSPDNPDYCAGHQQGCREQQLRQSLFNPLPTDKRFAESTEQGPNCLCSRCLQPIFQGAMRTLPADGGELRYHPACLGIHEFYSEGNDWDEDPDFYDEDEFTEREPIPDLGPCCACGKPHDETVRNIVTLDRRAPVAGTGWGCLQCGLPMDGALAVVCDCCLESDADLKEVACGQLGEKQRVALEKVTGPFEHDMSKHPEMREIDAR